ncbi:MAG: tRNA (adenosine(37)-N6)-dimethylallyltransferase MiaA [Dehalococcoidia bacterium]
MVDLIAIIGPTATGKSRFAIELAESVNGEIINADSKQIYKYMDIGTSTPDAFQIAKVKHHMYQLVNPDQPFSLGVYLDHARQTIDDVLKKDKLPILVGGTAQYIWAILEGWQVPRVPPNPSLRTQLENLADTEGAHNLHTRLTNSDPVAAEKIHPNNVRRVIRALEVIDQTGEMFSKLSARKTPDWKVKIIGLTMDKQKLQKAISDRVLEQFEAGWPEEVKILREKGYTEELPSLSALGYKEIGQYIDGHITMEATLSQITKLTHRFSRKQYGWFRLSDPRIGWIDQLEKPSPKIVGKVITDLNLQ